MDIIPRVTVQGERWDQISYWAYGSENYIVEIQNANPDVPIYDALPGGIVLKIPIKVAETISVDITKLPPWKQQ